MIEIEATSDTRYVNVRLLRMSLWSWSYTWDSGRFHLWAGPLYVSVYWRGYKR